jgi:hypothetical protein
VSFLSAFLILPRRAKFLGGRDPRGALDRQPSADAPAAGAPPAGPWQEPDWV